ncbi:phage tail tube protein [Marinobacterium stanieri]|uniref:Uncharacterized protein n=1 Tax=Marinobacterium stanieri TaxID=49186 RepID=A0A1N6RPX4_9GAMM|nr:hypothetical protein [Marinobacterium stanieri]SIQ30938.1 hypothetical protein SAMN05421647_103460 [Marinobacterium stanieri]
MKDFSLQGKVLLAENVNGKPLAARWVGDALVKAQFTANEEKRQESYSGTRRTSATMQTGVEGTFTITFNHGTPENFAIGLGGSVTDVAAASVTGEALPADLAAGDYIALEHVDLSSLALEDSDATPVALTEGTHYRIDDAKGGVIEILDPAALVQPFNADYDYGARKDIAVATERSIVRYLIVVAENTVDGAEDHARMEFYRAKFNMANEIDFHATTLSGLEVSGTLLNDPNNEVDPQLGGYGRLRMPEAV